jgi:hypothetical protein
VRVTSSAARSKLLRVEQILLSLTIIVNLEPRSVVARNPDAGVSLAKLGITHRPAAGVGVAQNQAPEVCTAGIAHGQREPICLVIADRSEKRSYS